uniref:(northern house mosquito) hypothetical protein n=1 Tax=Culex pipiens TaxID=7175 RepID=A0A8D8A2E7_CULPI
MLSGKRRVCQPKVTRKVLCGNLVLLDVRARLAWINAAAKASFRPDNKVAQRGRLRLGWSPGFLQEAFLFRLLRMGTQKVARKGELNHLGQRERARARSGDGAPEHAVRTVRDIFRHQLVGGAVLESSQLGRVKVSLCRGSRGVHRRCGRNGFYDVTSTNLKRSMFTLHWQI